MGAALASPPPAPEQPTYQSPVDDLQPDLADLERGQREDLEDDDGPEPREEDDREILRPRVDPVARTLWATDDLGRREERVYIQKALEYFQMIELYGILGRAVQIIIEGEGGLDINELMSMFDPNAVVDKMMSHLPGGNDIPRMGQDDSADIDDATKILSAFARVVAASPAILKDAYCVILDIPEVHRAIWAVPWAFPNITVDEGNDIMHTFIDQNWGLIEDFFAKEIPRLARRAAAARRRHKSSGRRSRP